jgi:hypothetical protein
MFLLSRVKIIPYSTHASSTPPYSISLPPASCTNNVINNMDTANLSEVNKILPLQKYVIYWKCKSRVGGWLTVGVIDWAVFTIFNASTG